MNINYNVITIVCVAVFFCVLFVIHVIHLIGKKRFQKRFAILCNKAITGQKELDAFFVPSRLITDADTQTIDDKFKPLVSEIYKLQSHKYYNSDEYRKSPCASFCLSLLSLNTSKTSCNKIYLHIEQLKDLASQVVDKYHYYTNKARYFTFSEYEAFNKEFESAKQKSEIVFPKYSEYVKDANSRLLPAIFNSLERIRREHNKQFVQNQLEKYRGYFDKVLDKYPLDSQQRESILKLEDNCLVIASAGSGKTSTIVGKAKYLVEKQHIDPSKILILTYTKKAANELVDRMNIKGINCGTFHSLAYHIIAEATGQAPSICEADVPLNIFHKLIAENKAFLHAIDNYIINLQSLVMLEHEYLDAFSYFEDRKKYGIQALFPDVDGNIIFTRSEEEKRLCSILTRLGIMFRYEYDYPYNTRTPERKQYKPDFTIYFKNAQGQWQSIFLEHFAIDFLGQVPRWFGSGTKGGWREANKKYNEGIAWKRQTHRQFNTILIETTSDDFSSGKVESRLKEQLIRYGVPIRERTDEELYNMLVSRNRQLEKTVFTLILSFVTLMKANEKSIDGLLKDSEPKEGMMLSYINKRNRYILAEIVKPFYDSYQAELSRKYEIDFTDAIIQATQLCREGLWKQYDYILVDEFQDISVDRYKLLQALRTEKPKTKLFCVGDDWQSIFRFAGSDMALFYDFEKYFGYTEICRIETTYRFHQPLIGKSSEFILKNSEQRVKSIKSPDGDMEHTYLNFVKCESEDGSVLKKVEEIVASLPQNEDVLLIGRYNYDAMSVGFKGKISNDDNRIKVNIAGRELFFLSVHSAKGLEADHVILVNCNQGAYGFPSLIEDDPILDFVLSRGESYPFAEERRLFYVAMTRAKKRMYVLYDQKRPSPFISEFMLRLEVGSRICPRCLEGIITPVKDGLSAIGVPYRSFICSNFEARCDFYETKFGDLTPPGILVTEETTAKDIEMLRNKRRSTKSIYSAHSQPIAPQPPSPISSFTKRPTSLEEKLAKLRSDSPDDLPF